MARSPRTFIFGQKFERNLNDPSSGSGETVSNLGGLAATGRVERRESGMDQGLDGLPALFSPQVRDGLGFRRSLA
jgi:hypothetical protein